MKHEKNRDDELVRNYSARKDAEQKGIRPSFIEPNFNGNRAVDEIDDDTIRNSQHSIKSDAIDINQSE